MAIMKIVKSPYFSNGLKSGMATFFHPLHPIGRCVCTARSITVIKDGTDRQTDARPYITLTDRRGLRNQLNFNFST